MVNGALKPRGRPDVLVAWRLAGQAAVENYRTLDALRAQLADKVARAEQRKAIMEPGRG